ACHNTADVTDRTALTAAVDSAAGRLGGLDVVVANAGVQAFGSVAGLDPEVFERVVAVNLLGSYHTLRAGIPHVRERRGYLLAVSSMAMAVHSPLQAHYNASKAGLAALADSLRLELAPDGVAVGVAHPTFVA
ncbi:MAG: SDR family NAD(P)-dependent oxidoreductase, partial [Mycobacteriales bacterium]